MAPEHLKWHAVRSRPRQEQRAFDNLVRQGYESFLPRFPVVQGRRAKKVRAEAALFPGYLFVGVDAHTQGYASIRSTYGVIDLVRFGNQIPEVPAPAIHYWQEREKALMDSRLQQFTRGDKVVILDGPFIGLHGVYDMPNAADRVCILLDVLGKAVSTTLSREMVARRTA